MTTTKDVEEMIEAHKLKFSDYERGYRDGREMNKIEDWDRGHDAGWREAIMWVNEESSKEYEDYVSKKVLSLSKTMVQVIAVTGVIYFFGFGVIMWLEQFVG